LNKDFFSNFNFILKIVQPRRRRTVKIKYEEAKRKRDLFKKLKKMIDENSRLSKKHIEAESNSK
jgi:hypothetical protein